MPEPVSFTTCAEYGNSILEKGGFMNLGSTMDTFKVLFI